MLCFLVPYFEFAIKIAVNTTGLMASNWNCVYQASTQVVTTKCDKTQKTFSLTKIYDDTELFPTDYDFDFWKQRI